jgi:hypothetical protein
LAKTPSGKPYVLLRTASVAAMALCLLVAERASAESASSASADADDGEQPTPASASGDAIASSAGDAADEPEEPVPPGDSWIVPAAHGASLLVAMRIGAAVIWPEPFADLDLGRMGDSYADAFSHAPRFDTEESAFEWDGDSWYINVVGHGLFGSELFMRSRICRRSMPEALALTIAGSVLWEYGFEASAVRPSGLDLVYTPLAGLVLGEARYLGWSAARRIGDRGWRAVATALFDPLGELERALGTRC